MFARFSGSGRWCCRWPNAYTSSVQSPTIPNSTTAHDGTYTVRLTTPGGCTVMAQTSVSLAADTNRSERNIRIKSVDASGTETDLLPRVNGGLGTLNLSVEELDGLDLTGYSYLWTEPTSTSATTSTATTTTLTAGRIGEYKVTLTKGPDTLVAYTTLRAKPCRQVAHTYACGNAPASPVPNAASIGLSSLAPGDTIRTGDFDVIVTEVWPGSRSTGGNGTWTGIGYTEIPYLKGNRIAVEFTGAQVNDCYEYTGGGWVQSAYDPNWFKGVKLDDPTNAFNALDQTYQDIKEFLANYNGTPEQKAKLTEYINTLEAQQQSISQSIDLLPDTKTYYVDLINNTQSILQCPLSNSAAGGRLAACSIEDTQEQFNQQADQLAQNGWAQLPGDVPLNELSFEDCIGKIDYRELTGTTATGDKTVNIRLLDESGKEVQKITGVVKGSFYRFTYQEVEYYYSKTFPGCSGKNIVLIHQYGDNTKLDGIFSYYDYANKKYIPFVPQKYPSETIAQMVHRNSRGFRDFADVTEGVFGGMLYFIAGGGPAGGRVAQAVEWLAFSAQQYAALNAPAWKNEPAGQYYERASIALALFQVGVAINDIRKLKSLPAAEKALTEKAKQLLDDGELDRVIREAQVGWSGLSAHRTCLF